MKTTKHFSIKIKNGFAAWYWRSSLFLMVALALNACIATPRMMAAMNGHFYKYQFAIREYTTRKPSAAYANNIFTINFIPQYIYIHFKISNTSTAPIRITWSKARIAVANDSSEIFPAKPSADTISSILEIGAGQSFEGFITPSDYLKNLNGKWTANEMYPGSDRQNSEKTDWIMGLIGVDIFKLYLPVESNGQLRIYPFTFYPIEIERSAVSQAPKQ